MVKTRSQMEHKTIDPKQKTKPSSRKSKPMINEKDHFTARISKFSSFHVIEDIKNKLTPRQKELFSKTCFGQFLNLKQVSFSGQLVHQILSRQLDSENQKECNPLVFVIGGKKCEFGLKDFALITGLDCSEFVKPQLDGFGGESGNGIRHKFFNGNENISCEDVADSFRSCKSLNDSDVVKLAQLYLLEGFLLGNDPGTECRGFSVELVDDPDGFGRFPWGRYVYECTANSMRRADRRRRNSKSGGSVSYSLKGFPFALQYWACECVPWVGDGFGNRIGSNSRPRMLNWGVNKRPSFKTLEKAFKAGEFRVESELKPTKRELGEGYFRYFLGQQSSKKMKKTDVVKEESPIRRAEQAVPTKKKCKERSVNGGKGKYARVEWLNDLRSEIIASMSEEIRKIVREEISRSNRALSDQMTANVTQILNKRLRNAAETVPDVVHIEMDKDDNGNKGSVRRKRKRSESEPEDNDIPCFTVNLFEHPHRDEKAEFDDWIKDGLKKNNKKMKYSNMANTLDPAFDFAIMKCDKKDWFFTLNESAEWLSSSHIDVALYYIRKKRNDHPDIFKQRSTTTDCLFHAILSTRYEEFKRDPENFSWSREAFVRRTVQGTEPLRGSPWGSVDFVYIPVNVNKNHWAVAAVDLRERRLNVYDSYRAARHDSEVMSACLQIAEMLPWILKSEGSFDSEKDIKGVTLPFDVKLVDGIPEQENGGDCGMFMLKFIEFLIQDVAVDGCTQKLISFFRNKMAVELYAYGMKRIANELTKVGN